MLQRNILIMGGYGVFGRIISSQLAQLPTAQVIVAGRDRKKGEDFAKALNVRYFWCDVQDIRALKLALKDVFLVINTAGPFQATDYTVPQACIEAGVHYIDLGDGRAYLKGVQILDPIAKHHSVFACFGASTSPAITAAMITALKQQVTNVRSIKIALTAGNKNAVGQATTASILSYVGKPIQIWRNGAWEQTYGWGQGERLCFPPPVGSRQVYWCEVSDLDIFPSQFMSEYVIFKAGLELPIFNHGLAILGQLRQLAPRLDLTRLTDSLISLVSAKSELTKKP